MYKLNKLKKKHTKLNEICNIVIKIHDKIL